ncbi:MAG TPA: response regulator, partial [Geobacteraceae bacterium]
MSRPVILLVDDSRLFLEMEKEFLQPCAVKIYTAQTGQEALDVVRMVRPDLIFMDLHMPEMDGATCCSLLKADPDFMTVPVVMVVTAENLEDAKRCEQAGCDHVLTKPVDRASFIRSGHRFLPLLGQVELRVPCLALVVFRRAGKTFYGTSANLSTQGIFIAYDGEVEVDDCLSLTFMIPGSDGEVVDVKGRVAWKNCGRPLRK